MSDPKPIVTTPDDVAKLAARLFELLQKAGAVGSSLTIRLEVVPTPPKGVQEPAEDGGFPDMGPAGPIVAVEPCPQPQRTWLQRYDSALARWEPVRARLTPEQVRRVTEAAQVPTDARLWCVADLERLIAGGRALLQDPEPKPTPPAGEERADP